MRRLSLLLPALLLSPVTTAAADLEQHAVNYSAPPNQGATQQTWFDALARELTEIALSSLP